MANDETLAAAAPFAEASTFVHLERIEHPPVRLYAGSTYRGLPLRAASSWLLHRRIKWSRAVPASSLSGRYQVEQRILSRTIILGAYKREAWEVRRPYPMIRQGLVGSSALASSFDEEAIRLGLNTDLYYNVLVRRLVMHLGQLEGSEARKISLDILDFLSSKSGKLSADELIGALQSALMRAQLPELARSPEAPLRELPPEAPALWKLTKATDKRWKPAVFLRAVWGEYIERNLLSQADLRRLDPPLMQALDNEFRGRRPELLALLPNRALAATRMVEEIEGGPVTDHRRRRVLKNLSERRARSRPD